MSSSETPAAATAGVFRVRVRCVDPRHEEVLLDFLRRNGHFAYAVPPAIEAVCAGATAAALDELFADVMYWWKSNPDATLSVELATLATTAPEMLCKGDYPLYKANR